MWIVVKSQWIIDILNVLLLKKEIILGGSRVSILISASTDYYFLMFTSLLTLILLGNTCLILAL